MLSTNNQQKLYCLIKHYILYALSTVQLDTHIDWIQSTHTYTYIVKYNTYIHIHIVSRFGADTFFYIRKNSYIHTYVGVVSRPSRFSTVWCLWFMKCPLVAPQSAHFSLASIAFCPADCGISLVSTIESNAGLLCDRQFIRFILWNLKKCPFDWREISMKQSVGKCEQINF